MRSQAVADLDDVLHSFDVRPRVLRHARGLGVDFLRPIAGEPDVVQVEAPLGSSDAVKDADKGDAPVCSLSRVGIAPL